MQLKDFLRPPSDNGRGIHFGLDVRQDKLDFHMHLIAALGMNWIVFYVGDEIQAANCARAAWAQHIMPIIRPACKIDGQILDWTRITLSVLSCAPAAWVQIFNEPGDNREWKLEEPYMRLLVANYGLTMEQAKRQIQKRIEMAPWKGHYNRDLLVQRWRQAASMVVEAGGYPGLQSMDPDEINAILVGVDDSVKDKMFFASHSYGSNHPPSYPYDARNQQDHPGATIFDDDTCALRWMEEREWVKRAIGFYPPLIITEGGWFYQQSEDNRYPRTDDALHAQYHVAVFNQFRGVLANLQALPDDMFAYCPWMWSDPDWDSWFLGTLGTRQQTMNRPTE